MEHLDKRVLDRTYGSWVVWGAQRWSISPVWMLSESRQSYDWGSPQPHLGVKKGLNLKLLLVKQQQSLMLAERRRWLVFLWFAQCPTLFSSVLK